MHRFRKKSDTRRQTSNSVQPTTSIHDDALQLPALPPASDFRTSLILPGLTRRFTLLRSYNGDPVALEDLKTRFAEQRARGAVNQISEEEEDMILEALGKMHFTRDAPDQNSVHSSSISTRDSSADTFMTTSSIPSPSKPTRSTKRYSNNLFGSGKFRDHTYLRNAERQRGSNRSALSFAPSEQSTSTKNQRDTDGSLRSTTPESSSFALSPPSTPNDRFPRDSTRSSRSAFLEAPSFYASDTNSSSGTEYRLSKTFNQDIFKRASMALEDVIREIEEEAEEPDVDEDIVLLRSPSALPQPNINEDGNDEPSHGEDSLDEVDYSVDDYQPGTALSSDVQIQVGETKRATATSPSPVPHSPSRTTSPMPRLPGYIPGMQRPMTPHDVGLESDDQSSSTTPKATTPRLPGVYDSSLAPAPSVHERRDSNASTAKQLSRTNTPLASGTVNGTPLFVSRSLNGRFTPEDRQNGEFGESDRDRHGSKRRLISPLSGQAYQSVTAASSSSSSIPSTASSFGLPYSNSTWQPLSTSSRSLHKRNGSGHSRNGSINSLTDITSTDIHTYGAAIELEAALSRGKSSETTRSGLSPALPDSPFIDSGQAGKNSFTVVHDMDHKRAPSVISGIDLGTPYSTSRPLRSPTPNESVAVRTKSPTFSDKGEKTAAFYNGTASSGNIKPSPKKHGNTESASSMAGFTLALGSTQPLVLSPFVNSSRSSLDSEGSSYHSWDEVPGGRPKDRVKALFSKVEADLPEWHDLDAGGSLLSRPGPFGRDEEVVRQLSGLGKNEFVGIQDRLIEAMTNKSSENGRDRNERANSALRKRRPSTSQSNYSASGKDNQVPNPSPAARSASPAVATPPKINVDQVTTSSSKANALLDSVINSIQASPTKPQMSMPTQPEQTNTSRTRTASEVSSPTRRNRNLADALFGPEGEDGSLQPTKMPPVFPMNPARSLAPERSAPDNLSTSHLPRLQTSPPGRLPMGQMSFPNLAFVDQKELALEVQRRVEAATIALRKSPSNSKLLDAGTPSKKKIHRDQISSPTLVSATTSVDTIPLPSVIPAPGLSAPSKFGQRFKKLTGTLKYKSSPMGPSAGEVTPFPLDIRPSTAQPSSYQSSSIGHPDEPTFHAATNISTTDLKRSKSQLVTSTTNSGPGLKGLMSRFRKSKLPDSLLDTPTRRGQELHSSSSTNSFSSLSPGSTLQQQYVQSAPAAKSTFQGTRSSSVKSVQHSQKRSQGSQQMFQSLSVPNTTVEAVEDDVLSHGSAKDEAALRQLYDAASNLGLDQEALNNLVARSTSTSSRSTSGKVTRASLAPSNRQLDISEDANEGVLAPSVSDGRSSLDGFSRVAGPVIRKLSIKKTPDSPKRQQKESEAPPAQTLSSPSQPQPQTYLQPQARQARPREDKSPAGTASRNTIIRRTIIMPSETKGVPIDINALLRKNSASNRKRRPNSTTSVQSKGSIQDRAPTPPPPKAAGSSGKRFSTDAASPPVPNLPHSFTNNLDVPHGAEKPSSPYDSLFEMYGGDSRFPSVIPPDGTGDFDRISSSESGPALEVIELANGETIWSIVNGLRDDDAESFYGNRASFASEYSLRESNNDGVQVYFKEHGRSSSKGSANSFVAKKRQTVSSPARPETKVFFSSSAHIGRLIENLSQGMDSGSFNILPNRPQSRGTSPSIGSESEMRWTVEERLEHMLGSIGSQP